MLSLLIYFNHFSNNYVTGLRASSKDTVALSNLTKAIVIILISILSFDLMSLIIKLFSNRYHILQISVLRNFFGFIPPLAIVWFSSGLTKEVLKISRKNLVFLF